MKLSDKKIRQIIRAEIIRKEGSYLSEQDGCPRSARQTNPHQAVKDMQRIFSGDNATHRLVQAYQSEGETPDLQDSGCWYGGSNVETSENTQNAWKKFLRKIWGTAKANTFNSWRTSGHTSANESMDSSTGETWVREVRPEGFGPYTNDHAGALQFVIDSVTAINLKWEADNATEAEPEPPAADPETLEDSDSASVEVEEVVAVKSFFACFRLNGSIISFLEVGDDTSAATVNSWHAENCESSSFTFLWSQDSVNTTPETGMTPDWTAICAILVEPGGNEEDENFRYFRITSVWTGETEGEEYEAWSQNCASQPGTQVVIWPPSDGSDSASVETGVETGFDDEVGQGINREGTAEYTPWTIVNDNGDPVFRVWTTARNLSRIKERRGLARRWRRDALLDFEMDRLDAEEDRFVISWGSYPGMPGSNSPDGRTYSCTAPIRERITDLIGLEFEDNISYRQLPRDSMWKRMGENLRDLKRLAGDRWEEGRTEQFPQGRFYREREALSAITSRDTKYEMLEVETVSKGKKRYYRPAPMEAGDSNYQMGPIVRASIDEICNWYKQNSTPMDLGQTGTRTRRGRVRRAVRRGESEMDSRRMQGARRRRG